MGLVGELGVEEDDPEGTHSVLITLTRTRVASLWSESESVRLIKSEIWSIAEGAESPALKRRSAFETESTRSQIELARV